MTNIQNGPFIVTGASGQLGRQVIDNLIAAGAGPIIGVSRSPEKLADLADKGIEARKGDFNDPASLSAAFAGGKRLLIISTDDLEPGKRLEAHKNAVAAATKEGITHIVYTSLTNPVEESPITFSKDHSDTEALIKDTGVNYTILRNNLYTDLVLMGGGQSIGMGQHFAAAAEGKTGYVTRADCARAAAAALMQETGSSVLDITGPAALSQGDIAAILSEISGKDIPYIPISTDDLVKAMIGAGLPEFMAKVFASFDEAMAKDYLSVASDDLEKLTGQAGQSARDFLIGNKAALLTPPAQ
ncbi:quinone oxidoreductase 2 (plasmid) [Pseudosulfitobacter pseudonitzschiae]|uniref:Quinone oxidoreductase 2 n=1 Tax=Pseudosulfitobacter pseudonitzschiae TaxID=1402135 RepID=A0A221K8T0_9RHOB|nr:MULTISPECIES: SDR family oxidoreductase [Roseobacteraceae]ASM75280.1 quinone oxidoreductase 2 [Pseudosulfitobacter pseudonitzschiae]